MQKLHLVGFTTDHEGLILSARRAAHSGSYRVAVDDSLTEAVEEVLARRAEEAAEAEAQAAAEETKPRPPRVESRLPVRDIQARLRQGRSINDVAKTAGVDPSWVERFADPVFAERAQIIAKVRNARLKRARLGPSALSIGDAVRQNLAERGVSLTPDELAAAWTARQLADGRWVVRVVFRYRNKEQRLRFDVAEPTGQVTAGDRQASLLGYVAPPPRPVVPKTPVGRAEAAESQPTAKRATVTIGFRPDPSSKAVSPAAKERERASLAMRKAAAKGAVESERAAARKTKEKAAALARQEREAKAAEARRVREQAAAEKAKRAAARAKALAAERAAAEKAKAKAAKQRAAQAQRAEAALVAAEKAKAAESKAAKAKVKAAKQPAARKRSTAKPSSPRPASAAAKPRAKRPTPKAAPKAPVAKPRVTPTAPPATAVRPRPTPRPTPVADLDGQPPAIASLSSPAADVYGPSAARALFRAGLVEQVREGSDDRAEPIEPPSERDPATNGSVEPTVAPLAEPVVDRPRRTRQLRAT